MSIAPRKADLLTEPSTSRREPMLDYLLDRYSGSRGFPEAALELSAMLTNGVKLTPEIVDYIATKCSDERRALMMPVVTPASTKRQRENFVYFLRNQSRVKIGVSVDPAERAAALSLRRSDVVGVISGGYRLESALHERFAAQRVGTTEWFDWCEEIEDYIATHAEPLTKRHRSASQRRKMPVSRVDAYRQLALTILGAPRT